MRMIEDWSKNWRFAKTGELPVSMPTGWEAVNLPHTWNAVDGQDGGNDYWRGTAMYGKAFGKPEWNGRVFLEFLGVAMTADVYVNGQYLTHHEGAIPPSGLTLPTCWKNRIFSAWRWTTPLRNR